MSSAGPRIVIGYYDGTIGCYDDSMTQLSKGWQGQEQEMEYVF